MSPEDLIHFIETKPFTRRWSQLELCDDDLLGLQILLCADPKAGSVIQGAGGVRKVRFSPDRWNRGTRGALRICYVYFEEFKIILLLVIYAKNERDNLSSEERKAMREIVKHIERALQNGFYN